MNALTFNGVDLPIREVDGGRVAWDARHVGLALGYATEHRVSSMIRAEWAEDFVDGQDFCLVSSFSENRRNPKGGRPTNRILLFESGVHLVCLLTRKPAGRALRRWLVSEVLPSLRTSGSYSMPGGDLPLSERVAELAQRVQALEEAPRQLQLPALGAARPNAREVLDGRIVEAWFLERCAHAVRARTWTSDVYRDLVAWCAENHRVAPSQIRIGRELRRLGHVPFKSGSRRGYRSFVVESSAGLDVAASARR